MAQTAKAHALTQVFKLGFLGVFIMVALGQGRLLFTLLLKSVSCPPDRLLGSLGSINHTYINASMSGKSVLVVGGTRGIGRGIATAVAQSGADCAIVGRSPPSLDSACSTSYSQDLSTVAGCNALADSLLRDSRRFDYVFFTVGSWPDYKDPYTEDGVEKVIALDLLARHVLLRRLADDGIVGDGAVVVNTLASTVNFPMVSPVGVKLRLKNNRPSNLIYSLFPVGVAADGYLRAAASRYPNLHLIGFFPGVVKSDIVKTAFPKWAVPLFRALMWPFSISELESGIAHLAVATSRQSRMRDVSFWNYLLEAREPHYVAFNDPLAEHVWTFLDDTANNITKLNLPQGAIPVAPMLA